MGKVAGCFVVDFNLFWVIDFFFIKRYRYIISINRFRIHMLCRIDIEIHAFKQRNQFKFNKRRDCFCHYLLPKIPYELKSELIISSY